VLEHIPSYKCYCGAVSLEKSNIKKYLKSYNDGEIKNIVWSERKPLVYMSTYFPVYHVRLFILYIKKRFILNFISCEFLSNLMAKWIKVVILNDYVDIFSILLSFFIMSVNCFLVSVSKIIVLTLLSSSI